MSLLPLVGAVFLPALLALAMPLSGRAGGAARRLAPWAALPVLLGALLPVSYRPLHLDGLLLGSDFLLDPIGRVFLLFSAFLWTVAGIYARAYVPAGERGYFFLFYLLAMTGNLGLPLAADAATFYLFFALMTFAAYGLVVQPGTAAARRAGRVYIVLAVVGEAALLVGLLMAAHAAGSLRTEAIPAAVAASPAAGTIALFLLLGFGIKAGAVPLHVWLPLAHPVAPTPASAVLSGSMIKAGLLGWLRFLPLGHVEMPALGAALVGLGVLAAFFGVAIGILQTEAKTVLAYSSISQMGLINVGIGVGLAAPEAYVAAVGAMVMYAAHHGLAKGALFLGVGVAGAARGTGSGRVLVLLGLLLPALAVAGAPLTSGSVAKGQLKELLPFTPGPWPLWLEWLLPLSAVATTLLMARFLFVLARPQEASGHGPAPGLLAPWAANLVAVAFALWFLPRWYPLGPDAMPGIPGIGTIFLDVVPIAGGALLFWVVAGRARWDADPGRPLIAAGDLLIPIERALARLPPIESVRLPVSGGDAISAVASRWYQVYADSDRHDLALRLELALTRWTTAILLLLILTAVVLLLLVRGT
jgi:formate hydrogenlyase subunit 3/multisubunit Na+/H+ antiporter MnhD subunit